MDEYELDEQHKTAPQTTTLEIPIDNLPVKAKLVIFDIPVKMDLATFEVISQLTKSVTRSFSKTTYDISSIKTKKIPTTNLAKRDNVYGNISSAEREEKVLSFFKATESVTDRLEKLRIARELGFENSNINSLSVCETRWKQKYKDKLR